MNPPAILVMARAPRRGEVRRALEPLIGAERCARLHAALITQAVQWAEEVAPGAVHIAYDPPDARAELRELVGPGPSYLPQSGEGIAARVADAAARVFGGHSGPLVIVWPDLPRMRPEHAAAAIDDLAAGCDLSLGPVIDGGFYLVAMPRPVRQLFALPEQVWRSSDAVGAGLLAARESGLEVGIVRAERALHRPSDLRAALADPLLAPWVRRVLDNGA